MPLKRFGDIQPDVPGLYPLFNSLLTTVQLYGASLQEAVNAVEGLIRNVCLYLQRAQPSTDKLMDLSSFGVFLMVWP
jgi:hypothetical protein